MLGSLTGAGDLTIDDTQVSIDIEAIAGRSHRRFAAIRFGSLHDPHARGDWFEKRKRRFKQQRTCHVRHTRGIDFGDRLSVRQEETLLLEKLVAGDHSAWSEFVQRSQRPVFARIVRTAAECNCQLSTADLEDICAEVFSGLVANDYASLRRFEGRSKLSTWLSVIARRVCLKRIHSRELANTHDDWSEQPEAEPAADSLAKLIAEEDAERVRQCMQQLAESDRMVLELFFVEGQSYQQMAAQLNLSINTIGPKIHRALQRLKRRLGGDRFESTERSSQA